ncbi:MAG: membrane-associated protein [Candidatus Micrarchaeota archaeon]
MERLDAVRLGIAGAVAWSLLLVSTAFGAMFVDVGGEPWGSEFVRVMGTLYVGFGPSLKGAFIGLLWGLFDGFLAGFIAGTVYNHVKRD